MFYDLNVSWSASDANLPRTLAFLHELGYGVVALNHTITGKLPQTLVCRAKGGENRVKLTCVSLVQYQILYLTRTFHPT